MLLNATLATSYCTIRIHYLTLIMPRKPASENVVCLCRLLNILANVSKKGKRKIQGVPRLQTAALPRHQDEEETDKTKQAQIEQPYEKHQD